jgi:hypothetical protein
MTGAGFFIASLIAVLLTLWFGAGVWRVTHESAIAAPVMVLYLSAIARLWTWHDRN